MFEVVAAEGGPPTEVLIDSMHVKAHRAAKHLLNALPGAASFTPIVPTTVTASAT